MTTQEHTATADTLNGEGWLDCACGGQHWGKFGAAGMLLVQRNQKTGKVVSILLQHRALWSDQGGTWGVPGGALNYGENAAEAALRESDEEADIDPNAVRVIGESIVDHGNWSYTTVIAEVIAPVSPYAVDDESIAVGWVRAEDVNLLPLHSGFAAGWKTLQGRINRGEFN